MYVRVIGTDGAAERERSMATRKLDEAPTLTPNPSLNLIPNPSPNPILALT